MELWKKFFSKNKEEPKAFSKDEANKLTQNIEEQKKIAALDYALGEIYKKVNCGEYEVTLDTQSMTDKSQSTFDFNQANIMEFVKSELTKMGYYCEEIKSSGWSCYYYMIVSWDNFVGKNT